MDSTRDDQHGDTIDAGFPDTAGGMGNAGGGHNQQGPDLRSGAAYRIRHEGTATFVRHQRR